MIGKQADSNSKKAGCQDNRDQDEVQQTGVP